MVESPPRGSVVMKVRARRQGPGDASRDALGRDDHWRIGTCAHRSRDRSLYPSSPSSSTPRYARTLRRTLARRLCAAASPSCNAQPPLSTARLPALRSSREGDHTAHELDTRAPSPERCGAEKLSASRPSRYAAFERAAALRQRPRMHIRAAVADGRPCAGR